MNILILLISRILSVSLNWVIVAVAVYEAYLMADTIRKLKKLRAEIMDINRTSSKKANVVERELGRIRTEFTTTAERDWNRFDDFCDKYQEDSVTFSRFSLIIQLFPLMGILGTVTGLYIAMNSNADWTNAQEMLSGIRFALSSTVLGIIFAVFFKAFDVHLSARYINYIDDGIERFRANYNEEKTLPAGGDK